MRRWLILICAAMAVACTPEAEVSGVGEFRLDPEGTLTVDSLFTDTITLPVTTDLAGKGYEPERTDETTHLTRRHRYVGKAWYRKRVVAPSVWKDQEIVLYLERTKASTLYLDGALVDSCNDVSTPQVYHLGRLRPGGA